MKKQIILGGFFALASIVNAQWSGSSTISGDIYRTGRVGIGTSAPPTFYQLDVQHNSFGGNGIRIKQIGNIGETTLHMDNTAANGHHFALFAMGNGNLNPGSLELWDYTKSRSLMYFDSIPGNVGFGTYNTANSRVNSTIQYSNVQAINVPRSSGSFQTTTNVWGTYIGSKGTATQTNPSTNLSLCYGLLGEASSGAGVWNRNYGVSGTATGGGFNEGGHFEAHGGTGTYNTGMYCSANYASAAWNDWAAIMDGKVLITGDLYHNLTMIFSDKRFKKDIQPLENTSSKLEKMTGYTYSYRTDEFKEKHFDDKKHIGLIAQEVKEVFPELIREDDKGYYAVNYEGMIPVLLEALKEQNKTNESQQKQIQDLQSRLNASENKTGTSTEINSLNSSTGSFIMDQNIPNPFSNETVIKYTLTEQTKTAVLNVYDLSGKQIASFPITEKGSSSITITSEKLAAGIYIYSIVADGKIMDSKRMVVAEK